MPAATLLMAGPGYGKTLALLAVAHEAAGAGARVLWYALDPYDADVATFFHYLIAGLENHIPQFGGELRGLLMGGQADPRVLWARFFEALASYNLENFLLVLDDLHHLEARPELVAALGYYLDRLPPGVRLAVSSRRRLPWALSKLRLKGRVAVIEQAQLALSDAEAEAFFAARSGGTGVPEAWTRAHAALDGWPLGLDLVAALPEAWSFERDLAAEGAEALTAYVAEELFQSQPAESQAFMLKASLLEELSVPACRAVTDRPDAGDRLAALEAEHLVQRLPRTGGYRFPNHLREFLRNEAARRLPDVAELHRRVAAVCREEGWDEQAIPHLIAARDWAGAIAECARHFPAMHVLGRRAQVSRYLEAFPPAVREAEPMVQLWTGQALSYGGLLPEAIGYFSRAEAGFRERRDQAGVLKALVRQATTHLLAQDHEAFAALLNRARALVDGGRAEDVADLYLLRAHASEQKGDTEMWQAGNEAVLAIPADGNVEVATCHLIARMNLFTFYLYRGDLDRARAYIEEAVETARAWGLTPYQLSAGFLHAHLLLLEGDAEGAGLFFRALPPFWQDMLHWHNLAVAHTVLGHYHQLRDDFKAAEESLRQASAIFERAGFKEGLKVPLERQLWLAVHRQQYTKAFALRDSAGEVGDATIYDLGLLLPEARARHLAGEPAAALTVLERVVPGLERVEARLHLARARLYEAASREATGDRPGAQAAYAAGLALIEQQGYRFLMGQDQGLWAELAEFQVPSSKFQAEPEPPETWNLKLETRAARLDLRVLGAFEVRVDGVLVDQWPRRKAKVLLAALALYPRGLTLLDLAEVVGQEELETPNVLRVNMFALRRALEPSLGKRDESAFVRLVDERYILAWDQVGVYDLRAFEAAADRGDRLRADQPFEASEAYDEALGHYKGNLLADGFLGQHFEAEREKFRRRAVDVLRWQAELAGRLNQGDRAEALLRRATEVAPCEEAIYLDLMGLHRDQGRPERVRQAYWDYRKALKAHTGMAPDESFEAAFRAISG